jgi:hypothetical protein
MSAVSLIACSVHAVACNGVVADGNALGNRETTQEVFGCQQGRGHLPRNSIVFHRNADSSIVAISGRMVVAIVSCVEGWRQEGSLIFCVLFC